MPDGTDEKPAFRVEITEVRDANDDGAIDLSDVEYPPILTCWRSTCA